MSEPKSADTVSLEYPAIKSEQNERIRFRDHLVYFALTAISAVVFAAFQSHELGLLFLITPATAVLGWKYLSHDNMVSEMRGYIRDELAPSVRAVCKAAGDEATHHDAPVFGWEQANPADPRRQQRKVIQLAMDVGLFVIPGITAGVVAVAKESPLGAGPVLACIGDLFIGCFLAYQFLIYSGLRRGETGESSRTNETVIVEGSVSS